MTKLCKQYLSDVKALFPIVGKPEKIYLAKLAENVEDFCIEEEVTTIEEIYNGFGSPGEIINTYLTTLDTSRLIKRIQVSKWLKRGIIAILLIALIGVSIYGVYSYHIYQAFKQEQTVISKETIIE